MKFTPYGTKGNVFGFCIIKSVEVKTSSKGSRYVDMILSDSEGEINAKIWNYEDRLALLKAGDIVKVGGSITEYNGTEQFRVEDIRLAEEKDNVNPADLVKTADYDSEAMFLELYNIAASFKDEDYKKLVCSILEQNREKLLIWPAAFKLHHAVRGGLLYHTLSIARLAESVAKIYPFIDLDLLLTGVLLHDIAKLSEFDVNETGIATGYSIRGNLLGHLADGAIAIRKKSEELGIPIEKSILVEHMILSHHGEPEFGAAVRPMFIEAELLSQLDLLDSRIYEMREAVEATPDNDFSGRLWALDNRKLFNHTRNDFEKKTKIF